MHMHIDILQKWMIRSRTHLIGDGHQMSCFMKAPAGWSWSPPRRWLASSGKLDWSWFDCHTFSSGKTRRRNFSSRRAAFTRNWQLGVQPYVALFIVVALSTKQSSLYVQDRFVGGARVERIGAGRLGECGSRREKNNSSFCVIASCWRMLFVRKGVFLAFVVLLTLGTASPVLSHGKWCEVLCREWCWAQLSWTDDLRVGFSSATLSFTCQTCEWKCVCLNEIVCAFFLCVLQKTTKKRYVAMLPVLWALIRCSDPVPRTKQPLVAQAALASVPCRIVR